MKTWIVSSLGEETIQGRKLYEEIRYVRKESRVLGHVEVAKVKWPQWSTCNLMNFSGAYLKWKGK